jgi:deazaflavin-dependent oxidoreductase (nitroreductase family)
VGEGTRSRSIEAELFRALNRVVEPLVRAGFGSAPFVPAGLILLETRGRRTGKISTVPLAAARVGCHVVVSTFRGRRSQWVKNLTADPAARYWLGGRARHARAVVVSPDDRNPRPSDVPAPVRWLLPLLAVHARAGWAFAVLTPTVRPS